MAKELDIKNRVGNLNIFMSKSINYTKEIFKIINQVNLSDDEIRVQLKSFIGFKKSLLGGIKYGKEFNNFKSYSKNYSIQYRELMNLVYSHSKHISGTNIYNAGMNIQESEKTKYSMILKEHFDNKLKFFNIYVNFIDSLIINIDNFILNKNNTTRDNIVTLYINFIKNFKGLGGIDLDNLTSEMSSSLGTVTMYLGISIEDSRYAA